MRKNTPAMIIQVAADNSMIAKAALGQGRSSGVFTVFAVSTTIARAISISRFIFLSHKTKSVVRNMRHSRRFNQARIASSAKSPQSAKTLDCHHSFEKCPLSHRIYYKNINRRGVV